MTDSRSTPFASRTPPPDAEQPTGNGEYEYLQLTFPRGMSRSEALRLLTDHAEYGGWELARVRVVVGGVRRIWIRRRIIRVDRARPRDPEIRRWPGNAP